jgi:hypothetical protein
MVILLYAVGLERITTKHIFQCMLERTDVITNEVLEPITFFPVAYRGGVGWFKPPPPLLPKFRSLDKAGPNSNLLGKYIRNNLIRIRVSPICQLSGTPD